MNKNPSVIFAYVHHNRQIAALVELSAQTDFALRTDVLKDFGNKLAMQFAAEHGFAGSERPWLLDNSKSVREVMKDISKDLGEEVNIVQWKSIDVNDIGFK